MITINAATKKQLPSLVPIYMKAFKKHNIFHKKEKEVLKYIKETHNQNLPYGGGYMVAMLDDPLKDIKEKVIGAILVKFKDLTNDGHLRIQLKHLAVEQKYNHFDADKDLIVEALNKVYFAIKDEKCRSGKVEVHLAEDEQTLELFKKIGFKVEGTLADYYRMGENCLILGKTIE